MKSLLIALLLVLPFSNIYSQSQNNCLEKLKTGQIFTNEKELKEWLNLCENDTVKLLNSLKEHVSDSMLVDKLPSTFLLIKNLSIKSSNEKVINNSIKIFISSCKSENYNIALLSIKNLRSYPSKYYDKSDLDSISSLIERNKELYKETVELAGYLDDPLFITTIKNVFPNSRTFSRPERWSTYKSLARLGDKEALDYCINRVSSLSINDQVIDALYPDLIYIHRKEAFDVLIKALNSDETLCSSSNPNSDSKIICGYRIMELLAPVIENFPVKTLPSGDLDTKDYKKTLIDVRAWFAKNGSSYSIINKY